MKILKLTALAMLCGAGTASAESGYCTGLAHATGVEPVGYMATCVGTTPTIAPTVFDDVRVPTDTGYTIEIRGQAGVPTRAANNVYTFALNAWATQTQVGTAPTQSSIFGMDFTPDGNTLYAATGSGAVTNAMHFGIVDKTTGVYTDIGALTGFTAGDSTTAIAIHPRSGLAYYAAAGGTPATSRLYTLNLATGALTLIGQITAPTDATGTLMIDVAVNCEGQIFAHNISDDALYSVDPATGAGTKIGTGHGLAANFAQGMDFDNSDGTLYANIYTGAGTNRFGTFDLATGTFATLVQDNPLGEYELAIPTQCPSLPDDLFANGFEDPL